MKKLYIACGALLSFYVHSQNGFKLVESDEKGMEFSFEMNSFELKKKSVNGESYVYLTAENTTPNLIKGFPEILKSNVSVALPFKAKPHVEVTASEYETITGVNLLPSKGSLKRNVNPESVPYEFSKVYESNEFIGKELVRVGEPYTLRNQDGVALYVSPFNYNPVTKELRVYKKLEFKVTYANDAIGKDKAVAKPSILLQDEDNLYKNHFINYHSTTYTPMSEQGSMLIICYDNFMPTMQSFVSWKRQKGIKTEIVPISSIGNNQTAIQGFVQTYYAAHPDLMYLLLVGDHNEVNAADAGMAGSEVKWSDTYYAFLNGNDHYPDIFVGRFSASNTTDLLTILSRNLEYEKNPLVSNWFHNAIGIGSDEGAGFGDDGEADWQHQRNLGTKLLAWGYTTFHEFFDGTHGGNDASGDPSPQMVEAAVNAGSSLFMYTGHGWQGGCVTSNYTSNEIFNSTNNGMYPFTVLVACNNGTFTQGTCLAEDFQIASNLNGPTGAISACGSSILMAWAEPMSTQDEIVEILTDQYPSNKKFTLGGLFYNGQLKMLDDYPSVTGEEVMETWVMFGDPSCFMRSKTPTPINATHAGCIDFSASTFVVNSTDDGAEVSITRNDTIVGTAYVQAGVATINLASMPVSNQSGLITVSGYNKLPYQMIIPSCAATGINELNSSLWSVYPNPSVDNISINLPATKEEYAISIINSLGEVVYQSQHNSENRVLIDLSLMAKGTYTCRIISGTQTGVKTFVKY